MLKNLPKHERPREKLISQGVKSLSNAELLAVLISSGSKQESAIDLAFKVLALEKDSLHKLSSYVPEEFSSIPGIGQAKACTLVAAIELGRRIATAPSANKTYVNDVASAAKLFMGEMKYLNEEHVSIVMLNLHYQIIGKSDVSIGGISNASAHPREVFAPAIKKGAAAIIVAHNHPSGMCDASHTDIETTKILVKSGKILGIEVLDHIIVGENCYTSLKTVHPELF